MRIVRSVVPALAALLMLATVAPSRAANAECEAKATEKKLAGAAKNSFMKKCEREAGGAAAPDACMAKAAEKKLAGAAKNSFVKKCQADAAASAAK